MAVREHRHRAIHHFSRKDGAVRPKMTVIQLVGLFRGRWTVDVQNFEITNSEDTNVRLIF